MKKITKVLALFALSSTLLVGCKNKDQSGDDSSSESGEVVKTEWTDDEKSLMSSHLHGIVLPFLSKEGLEIKWNEATAEEIGYISFSADSGSLAETEAYSKLFKAADGWQGGDESESESYTDYYFQKFVSTSEGKRGVTVHFCLGSAETPAASGKFVLEAYDNFKYEWPADAAKVFTESFDSTSYAPAFPGALHYRSGTYYNFKYINCFLEGEPAESDAGYSAILEAQDPAWVVAEEKDQDGYTVATSPDSKYELAYKYDEELGALRIFFQERTYTEWPAARVADFVDDSDFIIPAFSPSGATTYSIMDQRQEGVGYVWIDVAGAASSDILDYADVLTANGWYVVESYLASGRAVAYKNVNGKILMLNVYADDGAVVFGIKLPMVSWPAEEIAALYPDAEHDAVPAFTQGSVYAYETDSLENGVLYIGVAGDEAAVAAAREAYITYITETLSWTVVEDTGTLGNFYVSPNEEIVLQFYTGNEANGYVTLLFKDMEDLPAAEFPVDAIAALFPDAEHDVVPAIEGAKSYAGPTQGGGDYYYVTVAYETAEEAAAAYESYLGLLSTNGFAYNPYLDWFVSEYGEIGISPIYSAGETSFNIFFGVAGEEPAHTDYETWSAVSAVLSGSYSDITVPEITGTSYGIYAGQYGNNLAVFFESASAANAAWEKFLGDLTSGGYTIDEENGTAYISEDGTWIILYGVTNNVLVIGFY